VPAAFILSGLGTEWITGLSEDPTAHWIGTNPNAYTITGNGATALYAISFTVQQAFSAAGMTMHYAVADNLGGIRAGGTNAGVYVNGIAMCPN
jgi:hypothetical protein